jgi:hypothetical protein
VCSISKCDGVETGRKVLNLIMFRSVGIRKILLRTQADNFSVNQNIGYAQLCCGAWHRRCDRCCRGYALRQETVNRSGSFFVSRKGSIIFITVNDFYSPKKVLNIFFMQSLYTRVGQNTYSKRRYGPCNSQAQNKSSTGIYAPLLCIAESRY